MRNELASHFLLREDVAFLNHGSFGACPLPVFEDYQGWQRQLENQPVAFMDPNRGLTSRMRNTRVALAAEVDTSPDNIVGLTNATEALNIVAQSLNLREGDEILTTDQEYSALEKTWSYVARCTGAKIVVVSVPMPLKSEEAFTDAILNGFTDRTRVLFMSHITSPTALVLPIRRAIAEARKRSIYTVIDGAHGPGQILLDLDDLKVDFYAGTCHKWLMAPKGTGFLFVRPELQAIINPLVISHGWSADNKLAGVRGPFGNSAYIDQLELLGTRDPAAWLAVPAALDFRRKYDWSTVVARCQSLALETAARMAALTGLEPLGSADFSAPQMVAMPIPQCDTQILHDRLLAEYGVEIPVFRWNGLCIARLSIQGYNSADDAEMLINAMKELLDFGRVGQAKWNSVRA